MVELEDARAMLAPEQEAKAAKIFGRFDEDKDGVLRRVSLIYRIAYCVYRFSVPAILWEEVFGCRKMATPLLN
jgi:hypothetical protein